MKNSSKPDSLFLTLGALLQISLVLLGIIGLSIDFFRGNGLLKRILGDLISSRLGLASIPILLLVLYIANRMLSSPTDGKESFIGNLPLYLMMSFGLYYLYQIASTGSI